VLTVNGDRAVVERQLAGGELACPGCGGVLGGRGSAAQRRVRIGDGADVLVVPHRSRCRGCGGTHVLLPVWCLSRRADAAAVIGAALEAAAAGGGHRKIARLLGRAAATVRGGCAGSPGGRSGCGVLHGAAGADQPGSGDAGRGGGVGGCGRGGCGGAALARGRRGAGMGGGVGGQRRAVAGAGLAACRAQRELTRYAPPGRRAMVSRSSRT
jgi:hypothetical protein